MVAQRGSPKLSFRLNEADVAVLRAAAASVPVSELIRQRLTGRGPLAGIPWEALKLDQELTEIDRRARFEVLRQPEFLQLLRTSEEELAEWERQLAAAKRVTRDDGVRTFEKAQKTIRELDPIVKNLRALEAKAGPLIQAKAVELKKAAGLGAVADVPGGSLQRAIEKLVSALNDLDALEARYKLILDDPEIAPKINEARTRVEQAKNEVETLVGRYQTAIAERQRLREEREAAERLQRERAQQKLRSLAEESFKVAAQLAAVLGEIRVAWASHPRIHEAVSLAQRLNELRAEFASALSKAGDADWLGRPSRPVLEMLRIVRERVPVPENSVPPHVMQIVLWAANAWPKVGDLGIPVVPPPPGGGDK